MSCPAAEVMKHTPGPWAIAGTSAKKPTLAKINAPGWFEFARVVIRVDGKADSQGLANARLIAAAPDLLAALERFYYDTLYRDCPEAHDLAKAALEKARG